MPKAKRKELADTGRGTVGKTAVIGAKDRASNRINAKVVADTGKATGHSESAWICQSFRW